MPLLDQLTLPIRIYEAATPLAVWLMAEGFASEDGVLTLCGPIIWLTGRCHFIARRQDGWIEAVFRLRAMVYLVVGRKLS